MDDTWLKTTRLLSEIETCIKDDLQHTVLWSFPVLTIYTLALLFEKDSQTASQLAKGLNTAPTSFTPTLDRLENVGLIQRSNNASDRRSIIITLTSEGEKLRRAVETAITNAEVRYGGK